ncbi:MAG TPA: M48 family metallopeptidase [Fervidobacterium sp.]|nr:M48 family metallopeptidase [Fervidobacterium sp.]HPT59302.1 M48 family metallopeptidase [Fervidobacterium sp.]
MDDLKIPYLGVERPVIVIDDELLTFKYNGESFLVHRRYLEDLSTLAENWLRRQAAIYIPTRVRFLSTRVGITKYKKIRISNARSRWGSCSSKGTLSFNWRLIMAPVGVIDYVIIHELAHIVEMNHSRNFWKVVDMIMPDYADKRKWLRMYGHKLMMFNVKS